MIERDDIVETLISAPEIEQRLSEIAAEVNKEYAEITDDLLLVGVLNGAMFVMCDFARKLDLHSRIDWMSLSSYGSGTRSSGVVRVITDLKVDVKGRDVLIVEDIIDSGITLNWLVQNLKSRGAKSVEVMSLLFKEREDLEPDARLIPKWKGFDIPDKFVVGYGLDYDNRYRTLPYIGVLNPKVYEK